MKTINDNITIEMPARKAYLMVSVLTVSSLLLKDIDPQEATYLKELRKTIMDTLDETFKETNS